MSTSYSRTFLHLFARLHVRPAKLSTTVAQFSMKDAVQDLLTEHQRSRLAFSFPGSDSRGMVLLDHEQDSSGAVLLVACADRGIPDPTMLNIETSQTESFGARDGFSWAYSAHLFLSFDSTPGGDYPAVLEVMPRLSRTSVTRFINRGFRRDPYKNSVGDNVWPELEFSGDISNRLRAALKEGKLRGVDLLQQRPVDKLGVGETGLVTTRETLSLRPPRKRTLRQAFNGQDKLPLLNRLLRKGKELRYDTMRVLLERTPDLPDHIDISTDDDDSGDAVFIRRTSRSFSTKLAAAHDRVVTEISEHGYHLLREMHGARRAG